MLKVELSNMKIRRKNGFSLIEVIVAVAVAVLMLVALITLEVRSTALAARASIGLDTLPLAIERIEEVAETRSTDHSTKTQGEYRVITKTGEAKAALPATRITVEVQYNDRTYSELSLYKFNF